MLREHEIEVRVRYQETDAQARLHHANYLTYFELGRTELLRASGISYRDFEAAGYHLVVAEISCRYFQPAAYDDLLKVRTTVIESKGARVVHQYRVTRGETLLAEAKSTLACIDRNGRVTRLPEMLKSAS